MVENEYFIAAHGEFCPHYRRINLPDTGGRVPAKTHGGISGNEHIR